MPNINSKEGINIQEGISIMRIISDTCSKCNKKVSSIVIGDDKKVYCIPCSKENNIKSIGGFDIGHGSWEYIKK